MVPPSLLVTVEKHGGRQSGGYNVSTCGSLSKAETAQMEVKNSQEVAGVSRFKMHTHLLSSFIICYLACGEYSHITEQVNNLTLYLTSWCDVLERYVYLVT